MLAVSPIAFDFAFGDIIQLGTYHLAYKTDEEAGTVKSL
jgi:hypothetical protein